MKAPFAVIVIFLAGCSTATHIRDEHGDPLIMIQCGSSTSFSICYDRAAKECPRGYRTITEEPGFNRKTLKIACK